MIQGVHTMFYSSDPEATRAFVRDVPGFPAHDVGEGWLIFDLPEADLGVHPADESGKEGAPAGTPHVSFSCDDVEATMAELTAKGVVFEGGVEDRGYGLVTRFRMPGGVSVELYEPRYVKR